MRIEVGKVPVILLAFVILSTQLPTLSAMALGENTESNQDSRVERIEYANGTKTTYFKDGSKSVEVTSVETTTIVSTVTLAAMGSISITPRFPLTLIDLKISLEIVVLTISIISGLLAILGIKIYVNLRKRPDFYMILKRLGFIRA